MPRKKDPLKNPVIGTKTCDCGHECEVRRAKDGCGYFACDCIRKCELKPGVTRELFLSEPESKEDVGSKVEAENINSDEQSDRGGTELKSRVRSDAGDDTYGGLDNW